MGLAVNVGNRNKRIRKLLEKDGMRIQNFESKNRTEPSLREISRMVEVFVKSWCTHFILSVYLSSFVQTDVIIVE